MPDRIKDGQNSAKEPSKESGDDPVIEKALEDLKEAGKKLEEIIEYYI